MPASGATGNGLRLLRLLQLFDSQLPVGAFAHSGGLETYGQAGAGLSALRQLMTNQIAPGWGRGELAAACLAWSATGGSSDRLAPPGGVGPVGGAPKGGAPPPRAS